MPSCLHLPLKAKWFEMTKAKAKTEDYREINEYWVKRLIHYQESELAIEEIVRYISNYKHYRYVDVSAVFTYHGLCFKKFDYNIMTLGYPRADDKERILKLEHKRIEIRTGNPEWGAEPNKLYFVIVHGDNVSQVGDSAAYHKL
jgi:hypothetical protein